MLKRCHIACLMLALALVASGPAHAASLDPAFGVGGRSIVDFGGTAGAVAGAMAIQPDGKIVGAGWVGSAFGVVRLLPNGTLDPSFGNGGAVLPNFGTATNERTPPALALQPDGAIVVAGPGVSTPPGNTDFAVIRLLSNGGLDPSFGQGGKAVFQIGTGSDVARALVVQPDGMIVVAGYSNAMGNSDFAAIRLTPHGRLDTSFGAGGQSVLPMIPDSGMESASDAELLPQGRILLAGVVARPDTGFDLALIRLTPSGQPDPTFGNQGRAELALGTGAWQEVVRSTYAFPDGSFDVGGADLPPGFGPSQVALTRFASTGLADAGFASAGQFVHPLGTLEDTSSGIVVDGSTTYFGIDSRDAVGRRIGVLALDQVGNPDRSFADGGTLLFHITAGGDDRVAAIARRADGALVEFATVRGLGQMNDAFGFAVVVPRTPATVTPAPPPDTRVIEQPVAPVALITAPRAGAKLRRVVVLRGSAKGRFPVDRVDIALARRVGRTCTYLKTAAPSFSRPSRPRNGKCSALVWKRASGGASWRYTLKKRLPAGAYALYSRAIGGGLMQARPARIAFTVR